MKLSEYINKYGDFEINEEKLKVTQELKDFAKANNDDEINWDNNQLHYCLFCNTITKRIEIKVNSAHKYNDIYFTSFKIAQKAIETIGEDRLKKYYFEVG